MYSARLYSLFFFTVFTLTVFGNKIHAQSQHIVGATTLEEISEKDNIFQIYMDRYQPEEAAVEFLKSVEDSVSLLVFIGTWCRESKKYIPGLIKTLKAADSPFISLKYVGVDEQKKIPETFLKTFEIEYIPTVVVMKGREEIGRIEEAPQQLIETDLVEVLKGKGKVKVERNPKKR